MDINFPHALADAVFSNNALLSIGKGTPYIALLGRAPTLLPQLGHISGTAVVSYIHVLLVDVQR